LPTMTGSFLFSALVGLGTLIAFVGLWRTIKSLDPVEARAQEYGLGSEIAARGGAPVSQRTLRYRLNRLLSGLGLGPRLAAALTQADFPLTAAEFVVVIGGAFALGFLIGTWRVGSMFGLVLGAIMGCVPVVYLRMMRGRRQRAFSAQLPDVLTMLVGALRSGYGVTQALQMLVDQSPPPASKEFARVVRGVGLGLTIQQALSDMVGRVGTDELELVVTAINVQYETGGNLAETLDIIGETIRDRIRIEREIIVLTAQQTLSGYILAALPVALALIIFVINPRFFAPFLEPGWPRMLPIAAVVMQVAGFVIMRRILDIEV